jgi:hypothetical protein
MRCLNAANNYLAEFDIELMHCYSEDLTAAGWQPLSKRFIVFFLIHVHFMRTVLRAVSDLRMRVLSLRQSSAIKQSEKYVRENSKKYT